MKWNRQEKPRPKPRVEEARARLEETERRWPLIREAAAALRHERELNHFAENIRTTMRRQA